MPLQRLGPLSTGGDETSLEFAFYGFQGGLNVKGAGQLIADNDLTIARDGYLRPDGAFQSRNGMNVATTAISGAHPMYLARYYQAVKNGATVTPTATLLGQFNGTLYSLPYPTVGAAVSLGSVGGASAQPMTWALFQDPNDPNFTSGLTDCIVICTGVGGPYVYDGTNLYTPTGWATASGARWVAIVNGIIWFGGIPAYPNQIFGSGDGITASMESLPGYRNFVFTGPVAGLCAQGTGAMASLIVGRSPGISVLYGTGPSTFFLQDVPFADRVSSGLSMVSTNGVVYFLGAMAHYAFDAQTVPVQTSKKIEPWILNDPLFQGPPHFPFTQNRALSWSCVFNNRLHIGYCSNSPTPNAIACLDLTLNAWTVLTPTPEIASMIQLTTAVDTDPYVALVGSATTGVAYTWDYTSVTGAPTYDGSTAVLPQVQSKFFKLGVPGTNKALQRFYPEFQITSTFRNNITVTTDYGVVSTQNLLQSDVNYNQLIWDAGSWDVAVWGGPTGFSNFGSPQSRIDYAGLQAESFAFGVNQSTPQSPWIWAGGSGVFNQRGRT
jgi:hypothetical protein